MNGHTPGPWGRVCTPSSDFNSIRYISGPDCERITTIHQPPTMEQPEALANARLISAAPELLAALENHYRDACDRGETEDEDGNEYDDYKMIREAIEKATGEYLS